MKNRKIKIMLVEDSQNLRAVLKDYFEMMNYDVVDFGDGESAIKGYHQGICDICLLDIGLPKKDGYAVINEIHNIHPELPVIFVTARDSKEDRIKGFKAGCDDYVTKPFSTEELLLRIEAILSRCGGNEKKKNLQNEIIFTFGDFVFNYSEMQLIQGGNIRMLTRKEAQLLKLLYEHKNKLVPREILMKEIWGESKAALGRSLDVFLSKLRIYLKLDSEYISDNLNEEGKRKNKFKPGYEPKVEIINVHGTGYLLKIRE
ncbi:MAG: response regulator transcription factor [Bacteroidales bacterium]|jgi:DNA-binding response OmpR family regulator|nr:response regulator transcription factor [Bacteroidales bacterium]